MNVRRVAALAAIFIVLAAFAIARAGTFLTVNDPLQKADAVVVLGGRVPFRAMKAGALYKEGFAPEVWVTMGHRNAAEIELERRGIHPTLEHVYSQRVLEKLGVPPSAIHVVPGRNINTAMEMTTIAGYARKRQAARVILVTSSYHSRRVRTLWRRLVGTSPEAVVQYTLAEPFNARRWWGDTADASRVTREWFGLLNAWLGFPLNSEHW